MLFDLLVEQFSRQVRMVITENWSIAALLMPTDGRCRFCCYLNNSLTPRYLTATCRIKRPSKYY